jgi:hypothetical protein
VAIQNTQATVYMNARSLRKAQVEAAARAGISESTARRIESGQHASQQQPQSRDYKTRNDPLSDVWESEK